MIPGTIKIADHEGVFVIKMVGDVRLTLCLSFDEFIENMLNRPDYSSVVFDLTEAQAIDSTTLGLMAKISIKAKKLERDLPLAISNNPSITRLLVSMGFDDIFEIVENGDVNMDSASILEEFTAGEDKIKRTVLEAHRVLMDLNEQNRETFRELIETLEHSS